MFVCKLEFVDFKVTNSWSSSFLMKMIGLYDWSGNNPIIPELWLVPHFLPIHPGTYLLSQDNYRWCFVTCIVQHNTEGFEEKSERFAGIERNEERGGSGLEAGA